MDPAPDSAAQEPLRFPRVSGDGPQRSAREHPDAWFPPRERGWTLVRGFAVGPGQVSPA